MHSSLACLYQFKQSGIGSGRGIHRVGCYPKILLTLVDHFPDSSEKLIPVDDKML